MSVRDKFGPRLFRCAVCVAFPIMFKSIEWQPIDIMLVANASDKRNQSILELFLLCAINNKSKTTQKTFNNGRGQIMTLTKKRDRKWRNGKANKGKEEDKINDKRT